MPNYQEVEPIVIKPNTLKDLERYGIMKRYKDCTFENIRNKRNVPKCDIPLYKEVVEYTKHFDEHLENGTFINGELPGICHLIEYLRNHMIISIQEYEILYSFIYDNKPEENSFIYFFFKPYLLKPRIEFVKNLIKKCNE